MFFVAVADKGAMKNLILKNLNIFNILITLSFARVIAAQEGDSTSFELKSAKGNHQNCPAPVLIQKKDVIVLGQSAVFNIDELNKGNLISTVDTCEYDNLTKSLKSSKAFDFKSFDLVRVEKRTKCSQANLNGLLEEYMTRVGSKIIYKNIYYTSTKSKKISELECSYNF